MNELDKLYENLINDGFIDSSRLSLDDFKNAFLTKETYRQAIHAGLEKKGFYTKGYEAFENKYSQKKNPDLTSTEDSTELPSTFSAKDLSSDLFNDEKKKDYRAYFRLDDLFRVPKMSVEKDPDGQYIPGTIGDIINALPGGNIIDDQVRAFAGASKDKDVVNSASEFWMKDAWSSDKEYSLDDAMAMLEDLDEARKAPISDDLKKFYKVYEENGGDAYAVIKGFSEAGLDVGFEMITRSLWGMTNTDSLKAGLGAAIATTAAGALTGPGIAVGGALAVPAFFTVASANTDMMRSYAEFFEEELGPNYTREDIAALIQDKEKMTAIENKALGRGFSIAAVAALTAGVNTSVAGNVFRNGRKGLRAGAEAFGKTAPTDMIMGGTGELLAQKVSGQKLDTGAAMLETTLSPFSSIPSVAAGFMLNSISDPAYKINGGYTTKQDFLRRIKTMNDEQLRAAKFEVKNDESTFKVLDDKMQALTLHDEIKSVYGEGLDSEQTRRLSELELERKRLQNKKTQVAKNRVAEINNEIQEVVNIYNTKREAIGILSAPYYDKQVYSLEDAAAKRKTREYKQYKSKAKKLAETMGLNVSSMSDNIGGYTHESGDYVQELSTEVILEGATFEEAIDYASVLGGITPETQESTIAGMVVGEGEGNALQYRFSLENEVDLELARGVLQALELDFTMDTDSNQIGIIDLDDFKKPDFNKKIATFAQALTDNQVSYGEKYERVRSKYISADDRRTNLRKIGEDTSKYGKNGESVRYISEQADKRTEEYLKSKKPQPEESPKMEAEKPSSAKDNIKPRFWDRLIRAQASKKVRREFLKTFYSNSGLKKATGDIIRRNRNEQTALQYKLEAQAAIFNNQYLQEARKMSKDEALAYKDAINDYLSGKTDVVLSEKMKAITDVLRADIDQATSRLVERLKQVGGNNENTQQLIETLENNKGAYLHRAYSAFKDTSYMNELLSDPALARASINESYDNLIFETALDQGITIQEAKQQVDQYLVDTFSSADRAKVIGSFADGRTASPFFKEKNKNLTLAFRTLLGEIVDPLYNYTNTMEKISSYLAAVEYQDKMSNHLLSTGIGTLKPTARNNKLLELNKTAFGDLTKIYVDEDTFNAYNDIQRLTPWTGLMQSIVYFQSQVKYGKTILSPITTSRNFISGAFIAATNGASIANPLNWKHAKKAFSVAWQGKPTLDKKGITEEAVNLIKLGVLMDGGRSREIIEIINDIHTTEKKLAQTGATKSLRQKFNDGFIKLYSFGDDFYKAFAYYKHQKDFVDSGMDIQAASEKAAERVRLGQPTYSELPRNIRAVRRSPLISSFASFPYLIVKAHKENLKFIAEDFREGRKKKAIFHALSMLGANAATYGIAEATRNYFSISEEEDKSLRDMAPEYYRDTRFMYLGRDEETNEVQFFDINSIAPAAQIVKPIQILLEDRIGRDESDKLFIAGAEFLEPFLGPELTTDIMIGVATGKTLTGRNAGDTLSERLIWAGNQLSPGVTSLIVDAMRSQNMLQGKINPYTGKEYTMEDVMLRAMGIKAQTFNYTDLLSNYIRTNEREAGTFYSQIKSEGRSQLPLSPDDVMSTVADYVEHVTEYSDNIIAQIEVGRKIGLTEAEIIESLEGAGIDEKNINKLMEGKRLELSNIGTRFYKTEFNRYGNYPDVQKIVAKNLDMMNYYINERNLDAENRNFIYDAVINDTPEDVLSKQVWDMSENSYKRYVENFKGRKFTDNEVNKLKKDTFDSYTEIYRAYKKALANPTLQDLAIEPKLLVDMVFEKDPEIKSLLLFKMLGGNYDEKSLNAIANQYKYFSKTNIPDVVKELIELRINNATNNK